jgi:hypothetical protein
VASLTSTSLLILRARPPSVSNWPELFTIERKSTFPAFLAAMQLNMILRHHLPFQITFGTRILILTAEFQTD